MEKKLMVDVREASEILNISRSMLYILMERKSIKWVKVGKRTLFRIKDLNDYVDELFNEGEKQ